MEEGQGMNGAEDGRHLTTDTGINTSLDANQYSTQHMTAHGKANGASETEAGLARHAIHSPHQAEPAQKREQQAG
jgi:hypothetical protein